MPQSWTKGNKRREEVWKKAKRVFKKQYEREPSGDDYAIIMTIAKNMLKESSFKTFFDVINEEFLFETQTVPSGKKYLLLLDIDDTLLKANNIFIYRKLPTDKTEVKLTPDEYAKETVTPDTKKYYDYREFRDKDVVEKSISSGTPIWRNLRLMDDHIRNGWTVGVLTARGMEDVIFRALSNWLMFRDADGELKEIKEKLARNLVNAVNDDVKIYTGKTDFDKKANVIKGYIDRGYDKVKFVDDDMKNINAVREMAKKEGLQNKVQAVLAQGL